MDIPAELAARPLLVHDLHFFEVVEAYRSATVSRAFSLSGGGEHARYSVQDGVAVIPITGALLSGGDYMSGGRFTSYDAIAKEVRRATLDPQVRGIVTAINSPGGTVDGIFGAAGAIREARAAGKPVIAYVSGMGLSAAYWLAAQSDEIVLADDLTVVGSIGVYTMHLDVSKALDDAGLNLSLISSGRHKVDGHPFGPLPDDVRGRIQADVDDLRAVFAREVAAGRPKLSIEQAIATEARVFRALNPRTGDREAITHKLADRVAPLGAVLNGINRVVDHSARMEATPMLKDNTATVRTRERIAAGWRRAVAAANEGFGIEPTGSELVADKSTEPARAGWARAVAEANRAMLARHGSAGPASAVPAGPVSGNSSGWAKAIAGANSNLHPGAIRNGGAVSPGSGA